MKKMANIEHQIVGTNHIIEPFSMEFSQLKDRFKLVAS